MKPPGFKSQLLLSVHHIISLSKIFTPNGSGQRSLSSLGGRKIEYQLRLRLWRERRLYCVAGKTVIRYDTRVNVAAMRWSRTSSYTRFNLCFSYSITAFLVTVSPRKPLVNSLVGQWQPMKPQYYAVGCNIPRRRRKIFVNSYRRCAVTALNEKAPK